MICPRCKSPDVNVDKSPLYGNMVLPPRYVCNKCGHSGTTFPEISLLDLEDFEEEVKK